ncbi:MAG: ABC transporter permease, partial [Pseudomonadota bacterium]
MSVDTLPQSSIPITSPLRPRFGFLTSTPIIAAATVLLTLIVVVSIL